MSAPHAVVDLYLARNKHRVEVLMQGYSRLSDLFNNAPGEFISVRMRLASPGSNSTMLERDLAVRLRDVRLIRPIDEYPAPSAVGAHRHRLPARVVLDLDDVQVTGNVHLVDRIPWLDFAISARNRFISISDASVRFIGLAAPLECEYLLVNGARISTLYEAA